MRAGIVRTTLQIIKMFISLCVNPSWEIRVVLNGAILNQATNVRKNATHVKCRVRDCVEEKPNIYFEVVIRGCWSLAGEI